MRKKLNVLFVVSLLVLSLFFVNIPKTKADISTGLVGYWRFDEGSGVVAQDSSSFGDTGSLVDCNWTVGKFGYGLSLNGTTDYVSINNVQIGLSLTVVIWAKSLETLWSASGFIASTRVANGFILHPQISTVDFQGYVFDSAGVIHYIGNYVIPSDIEGWHQYGIIYNDVTKMSYIIFDGNLVVSNAMDIVRVVGTVNFEVGRDSGGYSGHVVEDEVRVYNRALSAQDISELYGGFGVGSSSDLGCSISPLSVVVGAGQSQSFSVIPKSGYSVSSLYVDSMIYGTVGSYTFNNVVENHTIYATSSVLPITNIQEPQWYDNPYSLIGFIAVAVIVVLLILFIFANRPRF